MLCSIILGSKIIEFYRYTENEKSNTWVFFLLFSIICINPLIRGTIEVNIRENNEKDKEPLIDRFHHL